MAKRFYWLKLKEDFFRQRQIKKLRRIAGGDTYTVIYLKMLLLAMKDDGKIALDGLNFAEELALELDEEADNVQITISYLLNCGLMEEINPNEMFVPGAIENVGSESDSAERVRKFREKQNKPPLQCNAQALLGNENVTLEKEIRDKRKEIREEGREEEACASFEPDGSAPEPSEAVPHSDIQKLFNNTCKSYPKIVRMTEGRRKTIRARWKENGHSIDAFETVFRKAEASDFLRGKNDRGWSATFDWLMQASNFVKVLEGNYDNKGDNQQHGQPDKWAIQPSTAETDVEAKLRAEGSFDGYVDYDALCAGD